MKTQFCYNIECGQCRSEIRLHVLCSLILIYTVHKRSWSTLSTKDLDLHRPQKLIVSSSAETIELNLGLAMINSWPRTGWNLTAVMQLALIVQFTAYSTEVECPFRLFSIIKGHSSGRLSYLAVTYIDDFKNLLILHKISCRKAEKSVGNRNYRV